MPWKETCAMDERLRFIVAASEEEAAMSEVCARFGISRQTGYKWLQRYAAHGVDGLKERSRAPLSHGRVRDDAVVAAALALRERYPHWGPKKLRVKLGVQMPEIALPSASTIGDWLRKEGLTERRRPKRRCPPPLCAPVGSDGPNAVWGVDFKGWFRTGSGHRCDPLTISDTMSRYLLRCEAVARPDGTHVRPIFEAAFSEFGLPGAIRSDNGPPFASVGAGGLSRLSVWWIKLGIRPERIVPGKPQQNGRHERMHKTLKAETARPPAATLKEQQQSFDRFREIYNTERPHEALEFATPASLYRPSARSYPCPLQEPAYPGDAGVRRVRSNGEIKWGGELIFVSEALTGEPVGVTETEDGEWLVHYADIELGAIDKAGRHLRRRKQPANSATCGLVDKVSASPATPQTQQQNRTVSG